MRKLTLTTLSVLCKLKIKYVPTQINFHNKIIRFSSTKSDDNVILSQLNEVLTLRQVLISSWIVESRLKTLCNAYKNSTFGHRKEFLISLAMHYTVNHEELKNILIKMNAEESNIKIIKYEQKLCSLLIPQYHWIFVHIGKIEDGVKFLADLRTDIRKISKEADIDGITVLKLQQLNSTLMELLSLWFSVGFLKLQRVTWKSSCEMLEKISEYEAVHPIRNWADLKRRVGPYRRCFVFTHNSMPNEPLVVLHTALSDEIHASMKSITMNIRRTSRSSMNYEDNNLDIKEDPASVKAAVFYSITSTQDGLHGIELGNYLIKEVVTKLKSEFTEIEKFSSLSPIPNFKNWLYEKLKLIEKTENLSNVFETREVEYFQKKFANENICTELRKRLINNDWLQDSEMIENLELPLMRLCAYYLFLEKRRSYAFDSVAHFHLKNGAVMWRLNWLADTSARGLSNSCGIMINYRYFLDETEVNSRNYIEKHKINASTQIHNLVSYFKNGNFLKV